MRKEPRECALGASPLIPIGDRSAVPYLWLFVPGTGSSAQSLSLSASGRGLEGRLALHAMGALACHPRLGLVHV